MHMHQLLAAHLAKLRARKGSNDLHILETGTIRAEGDNYRSNDGWSTLLFADHVRTHGGRLISIDLDIGTAHRVLIAHNLRTYTQLIDGHSIDILAKLAVANERFDVIFLDSDNDADLILHEYLVAKWLIASPGLILVDDVDLDSTDVFKGHSLVPWLASHGIQHRLETRTGEGRHTGYSTGVLSIEM